MEDRQDRAVAPADLVAAVCDGPVGAVPRGRPRYIYAPAYAPDTRELQELLGRRIPSGFAWARWGCPELAERVHGGARKVRAAREVLEQEHRVVLAGPAGCGKTALACAHLAGRILAGAHRAAFVAERHLLEQYYRDARPMAWIDLATTAAPLVLDDLGSILAGAPKGSGLAAQRIDVVCRLLQDRYDQGLGQVVTTALSEDETASIYGDGVARRVFEGACVVRLG